MILKRNNFIYIFLTLFICQLVFAQTSKYVVITIDLKSTVSVHPNKNFSIIVELDENNRPIGKAAPVFFESFTDEQLKKCRDNKPIYVLTSFSGDTYVTSEKNRDIYKQNINIIFSNRQLNSKVKFSSDRYKSEMKLYTTVISGGFLKCPIEKEDSIKLQSFDNVFLIDSKVSLENNVKIDPFYLLKSIDIGKYIY